MVNALLVPGRMALPIILCCAAFIILMSLILLGIGRHYPMLNGLMPSYLVVRRQGFILVTQDLSCDSTLVR
jgi:hypothetical protein